MSPNIADPRPIGIFDSGIGGLTVAAAIREKMPHEDIVYLGDTARVPYGDKSPDNICRFAAEDSAFLVKHDVKLIIAACNTVSAIAIPFLRKHFAPIPILGVLEAGVEAVKQAHINSILVIGTRATINSDAYRKQLLAANPGLRISSVACPLFVPIVEEDLSGHQIASLAMELYLKEIMIPPPQAVLLGCTHYPLLKNTLRDFLPDNVRIIDSASACADFTARFINVNNLSTNAGNRGNEKFYVTDMPTSFFHQAERFLGRQPEHVETVKL